MVPIGTSDDIVATHVHDIVENMHATYITMIADSFRYTSMIHIVQINMHNILSLKKC